MYLNYFQSSFKRADLGDPAGTQFASLVFELMDLNMSKSIDKSKFVTFCLMSCAVAVAAMQRKISEFFFVVDKNANGWIDFDEIDMALKYLGQPTLSTDERAMLARMTECENDEMEIVELVT
jgi:Ca2+-binding EF-hand superfamily protein